MQNKIFKIVNFKYERKVTIQITLLNVDRRLFSIELFIFKLDAFLSEIFNKSYICYGQNPKLANWLASF